MDTLRSRPSRLRRWCIVMFLALILIHVGVLAYLMYRIDPVHEVCFVPIRMAAYDAPCLAHLAEPPGEFAWPYALHVGSTRQAIEQALDTLGKRGHQPVVVFISAVALRGEQGQIVLLPGDAAPNDAATWLPLRNVLAKLQAYPSRHKLLVLDLTPAPVQLGNLYHDLAAALPQELDAVPDEHRLVLCAASAGQTSQRSGQLGGSVFGYYFQEALRGDADGKVTVKALAAFVQTRVERWTWHNRGVKQTPMLLGKGPDFPLAAINSAPTLHATSHSYPDWLLDAWRARDSTYRSGQYRLTPRLFQQQQATLLALEQAWRAGQPEATLRKRWLTECDRLRDAMQRMSNGFAGNTTPRGPISGVAGASIEEGGESLTRCTVSMENAFRLQPAVPGFESLLEEPALAGHAGEVRFLTRGYANADEAKAQLATASGQFARLAELNESWRQCEKLLDETLAELPWYVDALDALPELRTPWEQAAVSARRLAEALKPVPDPKKTWSERVDSLAKAVEAAEKHRRALTEQRQVLHDPFTRDALAKLMRQCRSPAADAKTRNNAAALLSVAAPVFSADDRAALWQACQFLSRRLNEETLAQDRQDSDAVAIETKAPPTETAPQLALLRAGSPLALLELAGVSEDALRSARQLRERCQQDAHNPAAWCKLGTALRRMGYELMLRKYQQPLAWRERERLAWLLPRWDRFAGIDDATDSPTIAHNHRDNERLAQWLQHYRRYLANDFRGLNVESAGIAAARSYYVRAAGNDAAPRMPEPSVRFHIAASVEPLTKKQPSGEVILEVTRHLPAGAFGPVELRVHRADDAWLDVVPATVLLPALIESAEPRTATQKVSFKVSLKPDAERTGLPSPLGFLVEANLDGRRFHHAVTTPIIPDTQKVQILVSTDPNEPATTVNELRLRPGKVRQPYHVYVKSLTKHNQEVHVEIRAGAALIHKSSQPLALEPGSVRKMVFDEPDARLTEMTGPLTVRVLDQDRHKVLHERSFAVGILLPRDYIKLTDVSYEPGAHGRSKWTIEVQATRPIVGPAIAAQLVLPMQRIPGLVGIGGGTLNVEVPTHQTTSRTLFAEGIRLVRGAEEEGPVYLNIDGVPRAFVYRTTFSQVGTPSQPHPDHRPAVRLLAPPCVISGINMLVDVEVDNAPKGAKLEVAMGRQLVNGAFKAEIVREFADAKKRQIDLEASQGALVFEASISDWTAAFDTRSIAGARVLEAKLLDLGGKVLASCRQSLVLDDSPPLARITPTVAAVKKGSVLHVQAQGLDPDSGIAQVFFFFGREQRGGIPQGASRFRAIPASRDQSMWTAALLIPVDKKGPLPLSVYVVNHAGLATVDTIIIDVTDDEPGKTGLGQIQGRVLEGPRPQPNVQVILLDERGKEIARTHTQPDGMYQFEQVVPGRYRVQCVKPESQRRAHVDVTIEADRPARVDLALEL